MILKEMQGAFGLLEGKTLALGEGLNIIEGPNEGGKSTWSAFLRAMLYGVNTKERDKKDYLAEKNRYQPWSGAAMEGRLDILWQGRGITLRRFSKGSTPFGGFEAVYTDTGEAVPGLTSEMVGEAMTGVSREIFERSAFVGQGGIAVDASPALEGRIGALCSSGEEEVSYSQVERRLKDWQNRRRHNKTGIIPKREEELALLESTLERQSRAHRQTQEAGGEMERLETERALLRRERDAHGSAQRKERQEKYDGARAAYFAAQAEVDGLEAELCRNGAPPDREQLRHAQEELSYLNTLTANCKLAQRQLEEAQAEETAARAAAVDPVFAGLTPEVAWNQASGDANVAGQEAKAGVGFFAGIALLALAVAAAIFGAVSPWKLALAGAGVLAVTGIVLLVQAGAGKKRTQAARAEALARYGASTPEEILSRANVYREKWAVADQCEKNRVAVSRAAEELGAQAEALKGRLLALTHGFAPEVRDLFGISAAISRALGMEEKLSTARVRLEGAKRLAESLPAPEAAAEAEGETVPRFDPAETAARLNAVEGELRRLRSHLDVARGELNTLGDPLLFQARREELLEELDQRRGEYEALSLALEGLEEAHGLLQERFSPALNRRAGELMEQLTGGKYRKVALTREFDAAAEEAGAVLPRRAIALSRGTADQLYLAVRLALCELFLPGEERCPLILDDALTNFDDGRARLALETLAELARERQVLLFTCHSREGDWARETGRGRLVRL